MSGFKYLLARIYLPHISFLLLFYLLKRQSHEIIRLDVERWKKECHIKPDLGFYSTLSYLLLWTKEFRNLYYRRLGSTGKFLARLFPGEKTLFLPPSSVGGGLFIRHGYSTFVNTKSIGVNCTIHQNTTIGDNGKGGYPIIGNNVFIGTGAIVIGNIIIRHYID